MGGEINMRNDSEKESGYILFGASFNPPHMGHFVAISQMLEKYEKVVIFPYPKKYDAGQLVEDNMPPVRSRMKMLEMFLAENFPHLTNRLALVNLSELMEQKNKNIIHTYDYLCFLKKKMPAGVSLHVCLGLEESKLKNKEAFYKQVKIQEEFGIYEIPTKSKVSSVELRDSLRTLPYPISAKFKRNLKALVGESLGEYLLTNNPYKENTKKPTIKAPRM